MLALIVSAAVVCLASLALGHGVLWLCGARAWSWTAPAVGLSALLVVSVPAIHLPGRCATIAVLIALAIVVVTAIVARRPAQRPRLGDLIAAVPLAVMGMVPFVAAGRAGTLGVGFSPDMATHLLLADTYRYPAVEQVTPLISWYPLGPHAFVGVLANALGVRTDLAFAGFTIALPILLGWTALAAAPRAPWIGRVALATVVGMPFLIAAYLGQGAFKELVMALIALAAALSLAETGPRSGWRRWIPFAVLVAGAVSVYSFLGAVWPLAFAGVWLAGRALARAAASGWRPAWRELRGELAPAVAALGVLAVALVPQIPRLHAFIERSRSLAGTGIAKDDIGNLVGPLPGWEVFGVWNTPDFRLPADPAFSAGMWTAFVLMLAVLGAIWCVRRGRWAVPAMAATAMALWALAGPSQSPYSVAKALVIASPLVLLVAILPLVQRGWALSRWWRVLPPLLAVVLVVRVVDSSVATLRFSPVGPDEHLEELRALQPVIGGEPTLFLGHDDFIMWELARTPVTPAFLGWPRVPLRPEKQFQYGQTLDFDSVDAATLNQFRWVITTRDAAGSEPPAAMRLARRTRDYELWRRTGTVRPRSILDEGSNAGAVLDCHAAAGRDLVRDGGVAAVRTPTVATAVPSIVPGASVSVTLPLTRGRWDLAVAYVSPLGLVVSAPELHRTLPANLERPGPRWPFGRISVSRKGPVQVTFHVVGRRLSPATDAAAAVTLYATRVERERTVPLRTACGRYVDWYRAR